MVLNSYPNIFSYFVEKYSIEKTKHYSAATILDPRFKLAGFAKKENGILAREIIIGLVFSIYYLQCSSDFKFEISIDLNL